MICQGFCISGMVEVAWIPLPFPARFEHGQGCEPACEIAPCIRVCIRSPWGVGSSCCDDPGLGRVCRAELVIFDTRGCLEERPSAPPVAASYSTGFGRWIAMCRPNVSAGFYGAQREAAIPMSGVSMPAQRRKGGRLIGDTWRLGNTGVQ